MVKESLRGRDVLVACKLLALAESRSAWTYSELGSWLGLSASTAHESADRCRSSGLLLPSREISRPCLRDLLVTAVPKIFYAQRRGIARGLPTGTHAAPLRGKFSVAKNSMPLVWELPPSGIGSGPGARRGELIVPIYPTAVLAAIRDDVVYELLALVDVLRTGTEPERARAVECLDERLLGRGAERGR
jgi:hypothetical protein